MSNSVDDRSGRPDDTQANKTQKKTNKKEPKMERGDLLTDSVRVSSEITEWLQEFRDIWWMMKFQYMEILTPVLLMKHLESPHSRDVRIWVSTVFILISLKTEIARSVKGPKLQGLHAEDAMASRTSR